jgi:hypothetical protein
MKLDFAGTIISATVGASKFMLKISARAAAASCLRLSRLGQPPDAGGVKIRSILTLHNLHPVTVLHTHSAAHSSCISSYTRCIRIHQHISVVASARLHQHISVVAYHHVIVASCIHVLTHF